MRELEGERRKEEEEEEGGEHKDRSRIKRRVGKKGRREGENTGLMEGGVGPALPGNGRCDDVTGGPVSPGWMRSSWPPELPTTGSSPPVSGEPKVRGAAPADDVTPRREAAVPKEF